MTEDRAMTSSERSLAAKRSSTGCLKIDARGIELHAVLTPQDEPIQKRDLAEVRTIIETWYEPINDQAFQVFASVIERKGWGRTKLLDATYRFLECRFPRWTTGDFFGMEPRLYPVGWYHERMRENRENSKRIGWYRVEGSSEPLCGWIEEIGDALPRWEFRKNVPASSVSGESIALAAPLDALPLELELVKKLSLRDCRIEELEEEVSRLERALASAHEVIDNQAQALIEVRHILASLQRGYAPNDLTTATTESSGISHDPVEGYPLPVDIDAAEGPNARVLDRLFHGVRGRNLGIHRISMSPAFHAQVLRSVRLAAEHPHYVYGILYEVIADQQEDFLLWDLAGGQLSIAMPETHEL